MSHDEDPEPSASRALGKRLMRLVVVVWTSPNTLLGLSLVLIARMTGGGVQLVDGVIEGYGGWVATMLNRRWLIGPISAITFGHVVFGQTLDDLDRTRRHERVHVKQYERWGPLFLPAYGWFSLLAWSRGRSAYLDNRFEVEAYAVDDPSGFR